MRERREPSRVMIRPDRASIWPSLRQASDAMAAHLAWPELARARPLLARVRELVRALGVGAPSSHRVPTDSLVTGAVAWRASASRRPQFELRLATGALGVSSSAEAIGEIKGILVAALRQLRGTAGRGGRVDGPGAGGWRLEARARVEMVCETVILCMGTLRRTDRDSRLTKVAAHEIQEGVAHLRVERPGQSPVEARVGAIDGGALAADDDAVERRRSPDLSCFSVDALGVTACAFDSDGRVRLRLGDELLVGASRIVLQRIDA